MLWKVLVPILLLQLGALGLVALVKTRPEPQPLEVQEKVWPVAVQDVEPDTLHPSLTLYARVDSPRVATLTAALSADVVEVSALEGRSVDAGELLVRLDEREVRLEVARHEAEVAEIEAELAREKVTHDNDRRALGLETRLLELIRRDVERAEMLATREAGSASRLDEARQSEARQMLAVDSRRLRIAEHESRRAALEARLARARAALERARLDAARTAVRAPFAGPVASVSVAPGDRVRTGDRLLTLYDSSRLELRAQVPTRHLAALRDGLANGVAISARARIDGGTLRATLDRLGAEVERGRGGSDAYFRVEQPDSAALELGRTVEITVSLPALSDVIAIRPEALYGSGLVYKLEGERMRGVAVERVGEYVSPSGERQLLVRSEGLSRGDRLVVTHLPNAVDGLRVRATESAAAGG